MAEKVVVAVSGGKDSAAAVLLLKRQGYDVCAVTMALGLDNEEERIDKLRILCDRLEVPLQVAEFSGLFDRYVRFPFASSYLSDKTPNPCALCNAEIKFGRFMDEARRISGAQLFATGHYASIIERNGRRLLGEPHELRKSQIYFLALIDPGRLENIRFPLAEFGLDEVRRLVRDLPLVDRKESQNACFLNGMKLSDYLERELDRGYSTPGDIVDTAGRVIGRHEGLVHYTVGQRRGVGFAAGRRLYVVDRDSRSNRLVLGEKEALQSSRIRVILPVYWEPPEPGVRLGVKIRYQTPAVPGEIVSYSDDEFLLETEMPVMSVTPGQVAVVYREGCITAAGEIA